MSASGLMGNTLDVSAREWIEKVGTHCGRASAKPGSEESESGRMVAGRGRGMIFNTQF